MKPCSQKGDQEEIRTIEKFYISKADEIMHIHTVPLHLMSNHYKQVKWFPAGDISFNYFQHCLGGINKRLYQEYS
jgi:hypothetical protein